MVFNKTCHKSLGNKGKTYLSGIIMAGTPALNHTHPFAERHKMRRGVQPYFVARCSQCRGNEVRGGSFAVGAGDMNHGKRLLPA